MSRRLILCATLLLSCLAACKVERPDTVLSDAKMEAVLYDYHVAKALGEELPYNDAYKRVLYMESVYRRHGITQAVFDSSMVWYSRNPEVLYKVYEKVNERLKAAKDEIDLLISIREDKPKESLPGDSIDVWFGLRVHRLTGMPLDNRLAFLVPSDSNFHDRDTLRWSVHFSFPNSLPDSLRAPVMAMQVQYEHDTLSLVRTVYRGGVETMALHADTLGAIKEVNGFVYFPLQDDSPRALLLDSIRLMRYHATDTLTFAPKDTLADEKPARQLPEDKPKALLPIADEEVAPRPAVRPRPMSGEKPKTPRKQLKESPEFEAIRPVE